MVCFPMLVALCWIISIMLLCVYMCVCVCVCVCVSSSSSSDANMGFFQERVLLCSHQLVVNSCLCILAEELPPFRSGV